MDQSAKGDRDLDELSTVGLSKDHLYAIGRVATEWSELMTVVDRAIWTLAGIGVREDESPKVSLDDFRARILTQHLSDALKVGMLDALIIATLPEADDAVAKVREVVSEIESLRCRRNQIVHGEWNPGGMGTEEVAVREQWTARKHVRSDQEFLTARAIHEVADRIWFAQFRLMDHLLRVGIFAA